MQAKHKTRTTMSTNNFLFAQPKSVPILWSLTVISRRCWSALTASQAHIVRAAVQLTHGDIENRPEVCLVHDAALLKAELLPAGI